MTPQLVVFTGLPGTGKSTLAAHAAGSLAAPVLGWDWVMAALRPYPGIQEALGRMDFPTYVGVGWSVMWNLCVAQLRLGRSVVLDAVAPDAQLEQTRAVAATHGAGCLVVLATCSDEEIHRSRLEGRRREIPGWHELDWAHVQRVKSRFPSPSAVDLPLDAAEDLATNYDRLDQLLRAAAGCQ
jgi:predicted kinase